MSDATLRELQRAWRASGALDDETRYLRERTRSGDLSPEQVGRIAVVQLRFPESRQTRRKGRDEIATRLEQLVSNDPLLRLSHDLGTGEHVLHGHSEDYVRHATARLGDAEPFKSLTPRISVAYQQTLAGTCDLESRWVKQTHGPGQFAIVQLAVRGDRTAEPLRFENRSDLEPVWVSTFERGLRDAMSFGGPAGIPFTGLEVVLLAARTHPVDTNERSFTSAARQALADAGRRLPLVLLQPWMRFELTAPDARPHELRSDLAQHGAYIEWGDGYQVRGRVPLAEIPRLRSALHARAPGRGVVTFEFDSHDPVPEPLATSIRETRAAQIRARLEGMSFWDRFPLLDRLG